MECSKKTRAKAKAELRNIPCKKNSISVELQPINNSVSNLALVYKKQKVEVINFPRQNVSLDLVFLKAILNLIFEFLRKTNQRLRPLL